MQTSARDLAMWGSILPNEGKHLYMGEQAIASHVVKHAATGVTVMESKASYPQFCPKIYGASQWRYSYRSRELIEDGRNNPGYKTQVTRFPNDNLAIASLSNDANGGSLMEPAKRRIIDDVLFKGQEPIDEYFEVEWAIGEEEGEEGLAFSAGFGGMEGPDAKAPGGVVKGGGEGKRRSLVCEDVGTDKVCTRVFYVDMYADSVYPDRSYFIKHLVDISIPLLLVQSH
ncbi:hypothetical protein D9756_010355 [Leucocoprinus leucothites]|uniref:Uncharacterized protein n=1 Tax=Leucocoprinus leucothites TaxID=201217 RepID=A0A8H5CRV6_9AGAR|nr:hypothetical protein D9756_010355 [Leucoagaricus leucothites]